MVNKKKERIFYLDLLRSIAILAVILCHLFQLYPYEFSWGPLRYLIVINTFGYLGVPIFFMLSGALLLNREIKFRDFYKKRFARIIYPYVFWVSITIILGYFFFGFRDNIPLIILGQNKYTWFAWTLAGLYLFIPIINPFIKEYGLEGIKIYLIVWVFTLLLNTFGLYPFNYFELSYFAGYLGFMFLGYYLVNMGINNKKRVMVYCLLFFAISLSIHSIINFYKFEAINIGGYLNLFVAFESACLALLFRCFEENSYNDLNSYLSKLFNSIKNSFMSKVILSVSILSYSMYFTHIIVINVLNHFTQVSNMLIYYVLTVFLAWLISFIFSKIPFIKNYTGI